jgi:hypothetical protein
MLATPVERKPEAVDNFAPRCQKAALPAPAVIEKAASQRPALVAELARSVERSSLPSYTADDRGIDLLGRLRAAWVMHDHLVSGRAVVPTHPD